MVQRLAKLLGLLVGTAIFNIVLLSPGLLAVDIVGGQPLEAALGITSLITSLIVVLYGSYALLLKPQQVVPTASVRTHEDYIGALQSYRRIKVLSKDMGLAIDQLERLKRKRDNLESVLRQRFEPTELSYKKFSTVIDEVEKLFYLNIRGMLTKLSVFDAADYAVLVKGTGADHMSGRLLEEKRKLYDAYLTAVKGYQGANEEILLSFDKLVLEIARLEAADYRDVEDMPCMKEMEVLIKQTKLYR